MNVIDIDRVWKKFRKGEKFNSFRDAVPNFFRQSRLRKRDNKDLNDKEFWALKDVSFQVKRGEVLGIIGPNGAGKSTILKLFSRIIFPNRGKITIDGRLSALIEVSAGFHPELTGRENIYLNGTILGMTKKEINNKFDEIVDFSGLSEFIDTPVKRYSTGMYSRLGFSVAAHMDQDILLVDEVLSVGDIAFQTKCARKMRELINGGATIVLISHNLALIQSLCKRAILLNKGEILKEGAPDAVISYYQNIICKQNEEDVRKNITCLESTVKVNDERVIKVFEVLVHNGDLNQKEYFKLGEPISIKINYEVKEYIEDPIFELDIRRFDGINCCSLNSRYDRFHIRNIKGKGSINVELGKINLGSGIYYVEGFVWDKDMISLYNISRKKVFKIEMEKNKIEKNNCIYIPEVKWSACDNSKD